MNYIRNNPHERMYCDVPGVGGKAFLTYQQGPSPKFIVKDDNDNVIERITADDGVKWYMEDTLKRGTWLYDVLDGDYMRVDEIEGGRVSLFIFPEKRHAEVHRDYIRENTKEISERKDVLMLENDRKPKSFRERDLVTTTETVGVHEVKTVCDDGEIVISLGSRGTRRISATSAIIDTLAENRIS